MEDEKNSLLTQRFIACHDALKQSKKIKSSRQMATALDYLPQGLSMILNGRREVPLDLLQRAVERYKINPHYLFFGTGRMFLQGNQLQNIQILSIVTDEKDEERIVHVPIPAQAGYATDFADPTFIRELPTFSLPDLRYKTGTHRSFDIAGDSMETTLFEGDKVICSFVEPDFWENSIKDNFVYVLVTKEGIFVKRLQNLIKSEHLLLLISDNDYYDPIEMAIEAVLEVWYVRAKITPFLPAPQNIQGFMKAEMSALKSTITQQSAIIENLNKTIQALMKNKD